MFYVQEVRNLCVPAIFERRRRRLGSKISGCGQLAKRRLLRHVRSSPRKQIPVGRVGMSAGAKNRLRHTTNGSESKASPDPSLSLSRTHVRLKNGSARTDGNKRTGICPGSWAPNSARVAAASRPALQLNAN